MAFTGGCMCGKVRFTIEADAPLTARACWCRACQYVGAGTGTANAVFPRDKVTITGETKGYESLADSGNHMTRLFCPTCGTPVFSVAAERPNAVVVRLGTLDDPSALAPLMTIWTSQAPRWACFDPNLPKEAGQPAPPPVR
ncbi:MAG: GFA family protein [Hyphomicrobiales bacterium]|nr:GFA family protein [Hyphomicrobiales bacterium]